jgi:iron complex outermembrane receptor protein
MSLGDFGELTPRLDYYWQDDVNFDTSLVPDPIVAQESYGILNFRLTWDAPSDDWSASFAVTNVTDELYYINKFSLLSAGFGTMEGQPGTPRQWLASVKRRF